MAIKEIQNFIDVNIKDYSAKHFSSSEVHRNLIIRPSINNNQEIDIQENNETNNVDKTIDNAMG